jgi:hypothetical protein
MKTVLISLVFFSIILKTLSKLAQFGKKRKPKCVVARGCFCIEQGGVAPAALCTIQATKCASKDKCKRRKDGNCGFSKQFTRCIREYYE